MEKNTVKKKIEGMINRQWEELHSNQNLWEEFVSNMVTEWRDSLLFDGFMQLHSVGIIGRLLNTAIVGSNSTARKQACLLLYQVCDVKYLPAYKDLKEEVWNYFKKAAMELLTTNLAAAQLCGITFVSSLIVKLLDANVFWEELFDFVSAALVRVDGEPLLDATCSIIMGIPHHFRDFVLLYVGRCHYQNQQLFVERLGCILRSGRWPLMFSILLHLDFTTFSEAEEIISEATATKLFDMDGVSFATKRMVVEILLKCLDTHEVWPSLATNMGRIASTLLQSQDSLPLGRRICEVLATRFAKSVVGGALCFI